MFGNLTGWHLLIILAFILLLFGAPKLPGLAKSLGQSMRIFKGEVKAMRDDDAKGTDQGAAATQTVKPADDATVAAAEPTVVAPNLAQPSSAPSAHPTETQPKP